jgi:outer membrane protein assembly factor BamB
MSERMLVLLVFLLLIPFASADAGQNWPQFRGPLAAGVGRGNPPVHWDVQSGKHILWTVKIPGLGHSSPVVWGRQVIITTAVNSSRKDPEVPTGWLGGTGQSAADEGDWSWQVRCYDRSNGQLRWMREVARGQPMVQRHLKATHANCTPATDGKRIVAFFGSEGLYCLNMAGELLWSEDFGKLHSGPYDAPKMEWGFASSPVLYNGRVILQCDCLNQAFLAILRLNDGQELLRVPRSDVATWSTPLVINTDQGPQIVCNGFREMAGYDLASGRRRWWLSGGGDVPVPTPLFADGLIVLTNGHRRNPIYAIAPTARGELKATSLPPAGFEQEPPSDEEISRRREQGVVWCAPRGGSYIPTPIIVGDYIYCCDDEGRLTVRSMRDGKILYQHRVGDGTNFSASAVAVDNRIYFCDESGSVYVIATGSTFQLLAKNEMHEVVMATPALTGDRMMIRTASRLVCIGD